VHYFPHHINDYAFATRYLSRDEEVCYIRLRDLYHKNERPHPLDVNDLARYIGFPEDVDTVLRILQQFYEKRDDGWHCNQFDEAIASYRRMGDGGRKGANIRWNEKRNREAIATPSPPDSKANGNQESRITNQESRTSALGKGSSEKRHDGDFSLTTEQREERKSQLAKFMQTFGKPLGANAN
jgi:uncharacterized protein YdaU (DUF1376 family)